MTITKLRPQFDFKVFINLIRALFPNWNFFDKVSYKFELQFKVKNSSHWETIHFHQQRTLLSLFLNPTTNLALAQINIIEHFAADIQNLQKINPLIHSNDVRKLTTFKMLRSLLSIKALDYGLESPTLQFKIRASSPNEEIDIYISDLITVDTL